MNLLEKTKQPHCYTATALTLSLVNPIEKAVKCKQKGQYLS